MVSKARLDLPEPDSPVKVERHVLEVVLARTANDETISHCVLLSGSSGHSADDGHVMVSGGTDKNGVPKIPSPAPRPGIRRVPSQPAMPCARMVPDTASGTAPRPGKGAPHGR